MGPHRNRETDVRNVDRAEQFRDALLTALTAVADPDRAAGQQAYMRSEMPFHGVTVPDVRKIVRGIVARDPIPDAAVWQAVILALWRQAGHREERYGAIDVLNHPRHRSWLTPGRIDLIEELVVTGAWWDFVDAVASHGAGAMLANHPAETAAILRRWAVDSDIWKRRTAILAQLRRKAAIDRQLLVDVIEPSIGETEFFLRKAIGWALREVSRTDPDFVVEFVTENVDRLSPLSKREALKILLRRGVIRDIPGNN